MDLIPDGSDEVRLPVIRNMILCEDVVADPDNHRRISLIGLLSAIHSTGEIPYPLLYREICVYVQMTECTGAGDFGVQTYQADTGDLVFETKTYQHHFSTDPLELHGIVSRMKNCRFSEPGPYWFEFCYDGSVEAWCSLVMR